MFLRCVKSLFRENHVFLHLHFLSIIKHWLPKHLSHAALSLTSFYFTRSAISTLTAAFLPCDMPLHQYKWIFAVHMLPVCWLFIIYSSYNIKITAQRNTPEPKSYSFGLSYMVSYRNGSKLHSEKLWFGIRKCFFTKIVVKHQNRIPRDVIDAPNVTAFKKHLGNVTNNML